MHQILFCSLLVVERWKIVYCTGHFIFTRFLRYHCWEIFFVKLVSFFEDHGVFWPQLSFHVKEPPLRGAFGLRHKGWSRGLLKGGGQECGGSLALPQLPLMSRPERSPSLGFSPFCRFYGCCPFQYHLRIGSTNRISTGLWLEELVVRCPVSIPQHGYCFSPAARPAAPAVCWPGLASLLAVPEPAGKGREPSCEEQHILLRGHPAHCFTLPPSPSSRKNVLFTIPKGATGLTFWSPVSSFSPFAVVYSNSLTQGMK